MSNKVNDELMERAKESMDYWEGTLHTRLIQRALDSNDLEALKYHITNAEREMAIQEDSILLDPSIEASKYFNKAIDDALPF